MPCWCSNLCSQLLKSVCWLFARLKPLSRIDLMLVSHCNRLLFFFSYLFLPGQHFHMHWSLWNDLSSPVNIKMIWSLVKLFPNVVQLNNKLYSLDFIFSLIFHCNIISLIFAGFMTRTSLAGRSELALKSISYHPKLPCEQLSLQDRWHYPFINVTETEWL